MKWYSPEVWRWQWTRGWVQSHQTQTSWQGGGKSFWTNSSEQYLDLWCLWTLPEPWASDSPPQTWKCQIISVFYYEIFSYVNFWTWLFHIFMNSFSPALTSVKSSIILLVLILNHSGSGWSSSSSPWRMEWDGMGRHVVLKWECKEWRSWEYKEIQEVSGFSPVMIESVVTTDEWSLLRSTVFIIVQLQELWQWSAVPHRLAHQDVGDGRPLNKVLSLKYHQFCILAFQ